MNKTKVLKYAIAALSAAVCLFILSSCSQKSSEKAPVELTFWGPFGGGDGDNMKQIVNEFNKTHKDIKVKFLIIPWGDYYTKLRISIVAASAPDIAICHASKIAQVAVTGNLMNLDELAKKEGLKWDEFSSNPLKAADYNGIQYAVPLDTHAFVLYYNVDILRKCGILGTKEDKLTFPDGAKSFMKYLEIVKEKAPDVFPLGSESKGNVPEFWIWYAFYNQFKDAPPYISNKGAQFNNKYGIAALNYIKELVNKKLWPYGIANSVDLFKNGKSAFNIEGVWAMAQIDTEKKLNFRVIPLPNFFDKQACWADSHCLIIPKQKSMERMEDAMKFVDWLTSNSALWAKAGHIPARKSVLNSEEFQNMKYRKDYAPAANMAVRMPGNEFLDNVNAEISRDVGEMMNNDWSAEKTMKLMVKDVNNVLQF